MHKYRKLIEQAIVTLDDRYGLQLYWHIFIPLTIFLTLMVKFPLRIVIGESFYDSLFYGMIALTCLALAKHIYRRFSKNGHRLLTVLFLCSMLAGWQVIDLVILRYEGASAHGFGSTMSPSFTEYDGLAWYAPRFQGNRRLCDVDYIYERYYGNEIMAITLEIKRDATWFACGG